MKIKKINIPIFYGELVIVKYKNFKDVNKKFKTNIQEHYEGVVFKDTSVKHTKLVVAFDGKPSKDVIAHEVVHLVNHIYIDANMQLDPYNDEPQAYLTGWFYKQIIKFFKK